MRKLYLTACAVALCYGFVYAQNTTPNCPQTLRLASSTYEQGRLHEVRGILDGCLKSGGFNDQEKEAAYKLLALSYLYLEEPEQADEAMLNLLRTNPYFEPKTASDPAEFIALYKTFRTRPIYRIGLNVGVNATEPSVVNSFSTVAGSTSEYSYKIGFQFGLTADLPISEKLTLNGGVGYQQRSFELTTKVSNELIEPAPGEPNETRENDLTATETQSWINIPITAQYTLGSGRYHPYASLGVSADVMLNANFTPEKRREGQTSIEPKDFPVKYRTNLLNVSAVAAFGSKIRVGGGFIVLEAKYTHGITKISNEDAAYEDPDLFLTYGVPYTSVKLNAISFTAGYIQNIFNPKKLSRRK
jgi:hypothetical protein